MCGGGQGVVLRYSEAVGDKSVLRNEWRGAKICKFRVSLVCNAMHSSGEGAKMDFFV